jgi:hypothetical protein
MTRSAPVYWGNSVPILTAPAVVQQRRKLLGHPGQLVGRQQQQ